MIWLRYTGFDFDPNGRILYRGKIRETLYVTAIYMMAR